MQCYRKFPAANNSMDKRGGVKIFRRKFFVSQCRKLSRGNLFVLCFRKLPAAQKNMDKKGGYHDFPSKNFCLRVPKFFVVENFCAVFQKISGSGKLYVLERWVSRCYVEKFLSHNAENSQLSKGNHLCCVSVKFRWRETLWVTGEYQDFPSRFFCLTTPKTFAGGSYCVVFQKNSRSEKDYGLKRGVSRSSVEKFFVSESRNFVGENFCAVFQKISGSEKLYGLESGLSRFSIEGFLYHNRENFGKGTILCCVSENFRWRKYYG